AVGVGALDPAAGDEVLLHGNGGAVLPSLAKAMLPRVLAPPAPIEHRAGHPARDRRNPRAAPVATRRPVPVTAAMANPENGPIITLRRPVSLQRKSRQCFATSLPQRWSPSR